MKKRTGNPEPQGKGQIAVETFSEERWRLPIVSRPSAPQLNGRARVFYLQGAPVPSRETQLCAMLTAVLQKLAA